MKKQVKQKYLGCFHLPEECCGRVNISNLIEFLLEEQKAGAKEVELQYGIYHKELDDVYLIGFVEVEETDEEYQDRIKKENELLRLQEESEFKVYLKLKEKFELNTTNQSN